MWSFEIISTILLHCVTYFIGKNSIWFVHVCLPNFGKTGNSAVKTSNNKISLMSRCFFIQINNCRFCSISFIYSCFAFTVLPGHFSSANGSTIIMNVVYKRLSSRDRCRYSDGFRSICLSELDFYTMLILKKITII